MRNDHAQEKCPKGDDEHDWEILSLANEKNKFGVPLMVMSQCVIDAFERGLDNGWYFLYDVAVIDAGDSFKLSRIMKLTEAGIVRRDSLKFRFTEAANSTPA